MTASRSVKVPRPLKVGSYTVPDFLLAALTGLTVLVTLGLLGTLLGQILWNGIPVVDGQFLSESPSSDMTGGGIWPAIYGTVVMTMIMTVAGVPIGVATAIYLAEYASSSSKLAGLVRVAVANLAGVPSIVFGLFGLGFFVMFVGGTIDDVVYGPGPPVWGKPSILWASLTLAVLTLPVVIVTTEEALRAVPRDLRQASLALGATQFQTVYKVVLPNARGGIMTGVILAIGRGAGEVAPIIFTGAANFLPYLPSDPRDMFMHLGYHVYALATQSPNVEQARPAMFGTVLVLLVLTFSLNLLAIIIRSRTRSG
jgi:phosphate transport system permease protein